MKINQRKAGAILSYVYLFLSNTISLFYTPVYLGMLGQSEYGLIATAGSLTSYLSLLSMGVGGSYIRFNAIDRASDDKEQEYKTNGMFQTIYFVISAATLVIGAVLVFLSSYIFQKNYTETELLEIKLIMICTIMQFIVTFCFNTTAMALMAYERFFFIRMCLLIACILQPIINLFVLYLGGKAVAVSVVSLLVSTLTYVIYYIFAKKSIGLKFSFGHYDKKLMKSIAVFSGFLFLNSITDQLTFTSDTLILGVVSGSVVVAIYAMGSQFKEYFMSFSTSVSGVFAPQVNKLIAENHDKKELDNLFIKVGRVQFYIVTLILTGYIFLGHQFIILWVTKDYEDAYLIGLFLMLAVYIPCFQNVGLEIQKAKNMHKARSVVYFLIAILNVIISVPAAIWFGGKGAAFVTLVCMFCGTVIFMNIYNQKKVGIDVVRFWKNIFRIFLGVIPPIALGIVMKLYVPIDSYKMLLLSIAVYSIVYLVSIWFISFNEYEKDLFSNPIKSMFRKIFRKKVK